MTGGASIAEARFRTLLSQAVSEARRSDRETIQFVQFLLEATDPYFTQPSVKIALRGVLQSVYDLADENDEPRVAAPLPSPVSSSSPEEGPTGTPRRAARRFQLDDCEEAPAAQADARTLHMCVMCGAFWIQWSDSWSLHPSTKKAGDCCDNRAMAEQIVRIYFEPPAATVGWPSAAPPSPGAGSALTLESVNSALKDAYKDYIDAVLNRQPPPRLFEPTGVILTGAQIEAAKDASSGAFREALDREYVKAIDDMKRENDRALYQGASRAGKATAALRNALFGRGAPLVRPRDARDADAADELTAFLKSDPSRM